MTTDQLERLTALRPQPTLDDPTALLDGILAARPARHRGRLVGAGLTVAALAAAVAVAPGLLPRATPGAAPSAAAAELHRLAGITAQPSGADPGPDQLWHLIQDDTQLGTTCCDAGGQPTPVDYRTHRESWTDHDGHEWRRDTSTDGTVQTYLFDGLRQSSLAPYPRDAAALDRYLRATVSGSNTLDEAVFVAVGDILKTGVAPADLRSAAVGVLARTPNVRLGATTVDSLGRSVEEFDYVDESQRPGSVQGLLFDTTSAQIVEVRERFPDGTFSTVVTAQDAADEVPADVLATAQKA